MKPSQSLHNQGTYLQVNGLRMYYEVHGEGVPVILLHGGLETCQMWAPVIPSLSKNYQVFTPDTRGHGRTDNPSGLFSFPLLAEDIALFIDTLGLRDPLVIGYSNGGQTALHMAMIYPDLVRGYMIGGIFNSITDEWCQMMQDSLGFEGPGMVDFEGVIATNGEFIRSLEEKHAVYHEPGYWKSLLIQVSQAWWAPPVHTRADFNKIKDRVLFWCGDRDVFCPPEQSLEMYRMVDKAELTVIPNADHFTMAGQFDIAAMILLNFMQRVIGSN
ncbi:MAG: alpha/beta fold hydrolase [Anaerolineales bacterium]